MSSSSDPLQNSFDSYEPKQELDSPFLNEEYLADEARIAQWRIPATGIQLESPFLEAFEDGWRSSEVEEFEEFLDESDEEEFEDEAIADYPTYEVDQLKSEGFSEFLGELEEEELEEEAIADYLFHSVVKSLEFPEEQYDIPPTVSQRISDALKSSSSRALEVAIEEGWRNEKDLTNLLFFDRHQELQQDHKLKPEKNKEDKKLAQEWLTILNHEVWPAIEKSARNNVLKVFGKQVASAHRKLLKFAGKRFKQCIEWAAREVNLNPGLLASTLFAETEEKYIYKNYLMKSKVSSYDIGVDDFFDLKHVLAKSVGAYSKVGWDKKQTVEVHPNDAQTKKRNVKTIEFNSGQDALLATAVYLKYGEVYLCEKAKEANGNFDDLPIETRFALIRIAMSAGRAGAAKRLNRAMSGEDILVRNWKPPKEYNTDRNATIRAAEALHLSDWIFGIPLAISVQPELEAFENFGSDTEAYMAYEEIDDENLYNFEMIDDEAIANQFITEHEDEVDNDEIDDLDIRELDPRLIDLAEKVIAREMPLVEHQSPKRLTQCFSAEDIAKVQKVYEDNILAANSNSSDRCSCIVMLNVALGQLLPLRLKKNRARGKSKRIVQMGNLTNASIGLAMEQLRRKGFALRETLINFYDLRNRTAGTLKPEKLKASVRDEILAKSKISEGCWLAFGLSIMDHHHSVLLLVDNTSVNAKIYWLDQFSNGLDTDVTNNLDQLLTEKTQSWWQSVMDSKHKGYNTPIRFWQLRKPS
jgi:hypothetical protein